MFSTSLFLLWQRWDTRILLAIQTETSFTCIISSGGKRPPFKSHYSDVVSGFQVWFFKSDLKKKKKTDGDKDDLGEKQGEKLNLYTAKCLWKTNVW